jgi:hypothetical protein
MADSGFAREYHTTQRKMMKKSVIAVLMAGTAAKRRRPFARDHEKAEATWRSSCCGKT